MTVFPSIRDLERSARQAATRVLRDPALYTVLLDLAGRRADRITSEIRFGYQQHRRSRLFGDRLKVCFVVVKPDSLSATVESSGTYGRAQVTQLASIPGFEFPPARLDLAVLQLEPSDVLRIVQSRTDDDRAQHERMSLSLFDHEGRLAWRVVQDIGTLGARTIFLDASDGRLLYERSSPPVQGSA